jgi:hypothetical protein
MSTDTPRTDARLREEARAQRWKQYSFKLEQEVERLRQILELIASPRRPDGTYNRSREACEKLAKEALANSPEEIVTEKDTKVSVKEPTPRRSRRMAISNKSLKNL